MSKSKHQQQPKKNTPSVVSRPQQPKTSSSNTGSALPSWLPIAVVLLITFICFFPTFDNAFVNWDDDVNIYKNNPTSELTAQNVAAIFTQDVIGNYNPLPILTFAIERTLFGDEKLPYYIHLDNLLLHLLCVYFVYRLVLLLNFNQWSALLVALLFGIHPMRVESVAWATERKDVLFASFYFAALIQYVKYLKSEDYKIQNKYLIYTLILFIFSLFSKVQAVSLPLSMLALDYYFKRPLNFKLILEKTLFWLGSLAMGLVNVMTLLKNKSIDNDTLNYTFFDRILVGLYAYAVYLGKLIFPWEMSPLYPYPSKIPTEFYVTPLVFAASLAALYWGYKNEKRRVVFGWVFFFVNFIFVSQILGAGAGFIADRFTYVPYFGFFIILAALTEGVFDKMPVKLVLGGFTLMFMYMTFNQVKIWKNGDVLWTHVIQYYPGATVPWYNRGSYWRDNGQPERALTDYNKALSLKETAPVYNSRGKLYFDKGNLPQAVSDYTKALSLDSKTAEIWANRAAAYGASNKLDSALADATKALTLDPEHINALVNRGTIYEAMGNDDAALKDLTRVIEKEPKHENAHLNRFIVYKKLNQLDKALAEAQTCLKLLPQNGIMWLESGLIKRQLNRCNEAIQDFAKAIQINPQQGEPYLERARCHAILGNRAASQEDAQKARERGVQVEASLLQ